MTDERGDPVGGRESRAPTQLSMPHDVLRSIDTELLRKAARLTEVHNAAIQTAVAQLQRLQSSHITMTLEAFENVWRPQILKTLRVYEEAWKPQVENAIRTFERSWKPQIEEALNALQRVQLPEGLLDTLERVHELARQTWPPNWPEDLPLESLCELIETTGWPLVWVPRAEIIRELANAETQADRERILCCRRREIVDDACSVAWHVRDPELKRLVPTIGEAAAALHHDLPRASQALAPPLLEELLSTCGISRLAGAHEVLPQDWKNVGIQVFRLALIGGSVAQALAHFYAHRGDPVPKGFNRHATAHTLSTTQYTETNAIVALMIVVSFVRELEQLRRNRIL